MVDVEKLKAWIIEESGILDVFEKEAVEIAVNKIASRYILVEKGSVPEIEGLNEAIDYFYKQIKPDYGQKSWFDPVIEAARAYQSKVKK